MKTKLFLLFFFTIISIKINAQSIPNGGFENWTMQNAWWEDPDNWKTNNYADTFVNSVSVTKTTDSYMGNYALQVINNWHYLEPGPLPGYALINYTDTNRVTKISAYVKCDSISGTGKGMIVIGGYLGGVYNGIASWETTIEIPQFTLIEIPLLPVIHYDSIQIFIYAFSSTDAMGVATGHVNFKVDELTEEIVSGIKIIDINGSLKVSPNPFKEYCILSFENLNGENYTLSIYNSQGGLVRSISDIQAREVNIQRMNLSSGNYSYKIQSANSLGIGKFIIE